MSNYKSNLQINNSALSANNVSIQSLIEQANNLPNATGGSGEQAAPEISVSSGGLITATAGTKSATKQLTVQAAQTITPSTSNKTIASGRYLTGTQTIKGDANLKAENIKSGVSIFGVSGSYSGNNSGSSNVDDVSKEIIKRTITEISDDSITSIGSYAFSGCTSLTSADFPNATSIGNYAFSSCNSLKSADFPKVTKIGNYAFMGCRYSTSVNIPNATSIGYYAFNNCTSLTSADFPKVTKIDERVFSGCTSLTSVNVPVATSIDEYAFSSCNSLTSADFPNATSIGNYAFYACYSLTSVILRSVKMVTLSSINAFNYCYHFLGTTNSTYNPNGDKDGYIYIPRALVDSYQSATNWSTYATQFRALEDYTVDGTITGTLDETKI